MTIILILTILSSQLDKSTSTLKIKGEGRMENLMPKIKREIKQILKKALPKKLYIGIIKSDDQESNENWHIPVIAAETLENAIAFAKQELTLWYGTGWDGNKIDEQRIKVYTSENHRLDVIEDAKERLGELKDPLHARYFHERIPKEEQKLKKVISEFENRTAKITWAEVWIGSGGYDGDDDFRRYEIRPITRKDLIKHILEA